MKIKITNQEEFNNRPLLPLDIKEKWLEALRGGEYKKGKHHLLNNNEYCCLGVLCEVQNRPRNISKVGITKFDDDYGALSDVNPLYSTLDAFGYFVGFNIISTNLLEHISLANLNDRVESFDEVIEVIEKYF